MNLPEARTMTGSHILVESVDSVGSAEFTVLLVHVVGTRARVVTDPDTEVLDLLGALLVDLCIYGQFPRRNERMTVAVRCERALHHPAPRTWFNEMISPLAFLIFRSFPRKYQNLDLATTSLGAKMRMR